MPALASIQQVFRRRFARVPASWVRLSNIHLTLKFLGSVIPDQMPILRQSLVFLKSRAPFEISLEQIGFFPDPSKARILWCGYRKSQPLNSLQAEIEDVLAAGGYARDEKSFMPHITLARFKVVPWGAAAALHEIAHAEKLSIVHPVKDVVLYQSVLRPQGAEYSVIESYHLDG